MASTIGNIPFTIAYFDDISISSTRSFKEHKEIVENFLTHLTIIILPSNGGIENFLNRKVNAMVSKYRIK